MESKGLSVVIPCYNDGRFIAEAVDSVIGKVEGNYEILIVDDGSTDPATQAILKDLEQICPVRVIHRANGGPAAARNTGILEARFEAILALDSDNLAMQGYLNLAPSLIHAGKCDVVYADALTFGREAGRWNLKDLDLPLLIRKNQIDTCAVFSKEIWKKAGGYSEDRALVGHEDWAFWLDVLIAGGNFQYLSEAGFQYRLRDDSIMAKFRDSQRDLLPVYETMLSRQEMAARFCIEHQLADRKRINALLSEVYGNYSYFQLKFGSLLKGYKGWVTAHYLSPRLHQFTRSAVTQPARRSFESLRQLISKYTVI